MAEVRVSAREAAYLRAFVKIALEMPVFRDTIDDEANQVIGNALGRIGRQLTRLQYQQAPLAEELFPLIRQPQIFLDLDFELEQVLRMACQRVH